MSHPQHDGQDAHVPRHNMLMLVERKNDTVCWMRPDAEISQADAEKGISSRSNSVPISSNHTGGANFGLLDGGVTFISETIAITVFQELLRGTAKERP